MSRELYFAAREMVMLEGELRATKLLAIGVIDNLRVEHERSIDAPLPHKRPCSTCELLDKYDEIIEEWETHE